jgi:ribonuclease PH
VGVVRGDILVDLCFEEDSNAEVDMNVVMDSKQRLIEVQSTAEGLPFSRGVFDDMLDKAMAAIFNLIEMQKRLLSEGI